MNKNEEAIFGHMEDKAEVVDNEDYLHFAIRLYATEELKKGSFENMDAFDAYIGELYRERHIIPEDSDIELIKENIIKARKNKLTRETAELLRSSNNSDTNRTENYNSIREELVNLGKKPSSYFESKFKGGNIK